jgi:hypothetical protein
MLAAAVAALANAVPAAARELRPCRPGTSEYKEARAKLDALDAEIRGLAPAADPAPVERKLAALEKQSCFALAGHLAVRARSGLALRTWWEDGGQAAAAGALELGGDDPVVWVAPNIRRTLTLETDPGHRLTPLLCSAYEDACGRDTDGWRRRAEASFRRAEAVRHAHGEGETLDGWPYLRPPDQTDCVAYGRKAPRHRQLASYRRCLAVAAIRAPAFAIGRVKKPTEGWLIVTGWQGHYDACNERRAFDLATGSAYRVAGCSVLLSDGSVDRQATDAARRIVRERGTVSLDKIREAAWILLQLGEIDEWKVITGFGVSLPSGIAPGSDARYGFTSGRGGGMPSSMNTPVYWEVGMGSRVLGGRDIPWPGDLNNVPEFYAAKLLEVAETSFTPGCPAAKPPTNAASLGEGASPLDQSWRELLAEPCPRR